MAIRVYLKIETIQGYCPVEPDDHTSPPIVYRRDCMRNMGHEDGAIPDDEVSARRMSRRSIWRMKGNFVSGCSCMAGAGRAFSPVTAALPSTMP